MDLATHDNGVTKMRLYENGKDCKTANCDVNIRGGSSIHDPKNSYKLKLLGKKQSLLGMRSDEDWILGAVYDDMGMIHNTLSFEVWNQMAASNEVEKDYSTNMAYVEVIYDGQYIGVYILMERIDKKELSLDDQDILYKMKNWLWAYDTPYDSFYLKYPKKESELTTGLIREFVDAFWMDTEKDYSKQTDMLVYDNAIDFGLFCLLTAGLDNTLKNSYFAAVLQPDGTYKFIEVPWDLNGTWGCSYRWEFSDNSIQNKDNFSYVVRALYRLEPQKTAQDMYGRWRELRKNIVTTENILSIIDRNTLYLQNSGAYQRNYLKWPTSNTFRDYVDNEEFMTEDVWDNSYIYRYVEGRIAFLDNYLKEQAQNPDMTLFEDEDW